MKKKILINFVYTMSLAVVLLGCADEETPPAVVNDFASVGSGYEEANGDATVTIPFRNLSKTITIDDLIFAGTATEGADYQVLGVTSEGVQIKLIDDNTPEIVETIRITIAGNSTGNAIHTITLVSNDPGFLDVDLVWGDNSDLDLYSLYYDEDDEDWHVIDFSDPGNTLDPIDWTDPDGLYGFSYNYWGGTNDALDFSSVFTPTGVTVNGGGTPLIFDATYSLANIDKVNIQIEQTCVKTGIAFTDFSEIEVPASGSRVNPDRERLMIKMRDAIARYKAEHPGK